MAPKAKAKGLAAKAKPKAKAKAKAHMRGARAKAKAGARIGGLARGRRALRRPAADEAGERPGRDHRTLWGAGHTLRAAEIGLEWPLKEKGVVFEEAKYFHRECKVAGVALGALVSEGQVALRIRPSGTTDEGLLKVQSGTPHLELRVLLRAADCTHEVVGEDLVHGIRLRKRREVEAEEAWVDNLMKVAPTEQVDELEVLRREMERQGQVAPMKEKVKDKEKKDKKTHKDRVKDRKEKKEKEKVKAKRRKSTSPGTSSGDIALDGSRAKAAAQKTPKKLYQGTGMDPSDRARSRVIRLARKYVKRKGRKSSSGSQSSSGSSQGGNVEEEGDTIFQQAARVKGVAESFPGVLAFQGLSQMRSNLLQSLGEEEKSSSTQAVAVQYFRQVLQRKATGAVARELLSLCAAADFLVRSRPAQALDLLIQRIKRQSPP